MATLDIKTIKHKVEWCLKNYPQTKDNDTYLVLSVYKNFYRSDYEDFLLKSLSVMKIEQPSELLNSRGGHMSKLPSFGSITRCRRKFNEEGMYLGSAQTMVKRGRKVIEVQRDIAGWENL